MIYSSDQNQPKFHFHPTTILNQTETTPWDYILDRRAPIDWTSRNLWKIVTPTIHDLYWSLSKQLWTSHRIHGECDACADGPASGRLLVVMARQLQQTAAEGQNNKFFGCKSNPCSKLVSNQNFFGNATHVTKETSESHEIIQRQPADGWPNATSAITP